MDIQYFNGNSPIVPKLNEMVRLLNSLQNITGDGYVEIRRTGSGVTAALNIDRVKGQLAINGGGGEAGTQVRRAITTQAAPNDVKITANIYDGDGIEQTEGDESGVDIYAKIAGDGTLKLNKCLPFLVDNTEIDIAKFTVDVSGTPTERWYIVGQIFQPINTSLFIFDETTNALTLKLNDDHLEVDATDGLQTTLFECA